MQVLSVIWMMISIISVACLTSIITSDMVDTSVSLHNKQIAIVKDSWEEFLARLLVNRYRSSQNILKTSNYTELLDVIASNTTLDAALVDHNILSMMQDEMKKRDLGKSI